MAPVAGALKPTEKAVEKELVSGGVTAIAGAGAAEEEIGKAGQVVG